MSAENFSQFSSVVFLKFKLKKRSVRNVSQCSTLPENARFGPAAVTIATRGRLRNAKMWGFF